MSQRRQGKRNNNRRSVNSSIQRETRPVRTVGAPVNQAAPPRVPAPVMLKEPKYIDTSAVATAAPSTGVFASLSATVNGTTDITRIGDQIELHSLEFRFSITVADSSNLVRVIVFQWLADDTSDVPSASKLLQAPGAQPYNSAINHDNSSKLTILYDKVIPTATYYPVKHESVLIALDRSPVRKILKYAAGASTGNNMIYLFMCSDSGPSPHPSVDYYARVNFYDC